MASVRRSRGVRGHGFIRSPSRYLLAARAAGEDSLVAVAPSRAPRVAPCACVVRDHRAQPVTEIITFVDEGLGHSSHLVDLGDGRALVIDPPRIPHRQI